MDTVTLILPLEATTDINPSESSGATAGAIEGATSGALIDKDRATDSATIDNC